MVLGAVVFLLACMEAATAYVPSTWIQRDGRFYTNVNVTLVENGNVDQSEWAASWYERDLGWNRNLDAAWSNVSLGRNGERVPKHPILMPLLSTPLFWALGLDGLLLFNLLCFGLAGAGAFAFARRYASPGSAAFAAGAFLLATGVRTHVYDYHVDVLLLAAWLAGLAAVHAKRGVLAGVLVAVAVMLKPTTILLVPAAALLARPDRRTLGWAVLAGTLALGAWGVKNWIVFGRPWWAGYNRMLVVEDGQAALARLDAFTVPLREGLTNLWAGPYGLRHRMPLALVGVGGLVLLARRRPWAALAVLATVGAVVLLFAKYLWYGDRFLWPALALALPGLALTVDWLAGWARRERDVFRAGLGGTLVAVVILLGHHRERASEPGAWLAVLTFGLLAAATTRAARRTTRSAAALSAPLVLLLFPGAIERGLSFGPDLTFALAVMAALASRRAAWAAAFALSAGLVFFFQTDLSALAAAEPVAWDVGAGRGTAVLLGVALLLAPLLGRRAPLLAPLLLLASPMVRNLGIPVPLFAVAVASLALPAPLERLAGWARDRWREGPPASRTLVALSPLLLLLLVGWSKHRPAPFRAATEAGVRAAEVRLAHIPCDFLAWEHFNWECATYDRGVHGEVGLSTSAPLHVGGFEARMLHLPAPGGRPRRVRWEDLEAGQTLVVQLAVPDEARGGGTLGIRLGGEPLDAIELPREPDGRLDTRRYPTGRAGERVDLELELETRGSSVLVDAWFE